jgi:hypothetical protein
MADPKADQTPKADPKDSKPANKIEIKPKLDLRVEDNNFELFVECAVYLDGKGLSKQVVLVKEKLAIRGNGTTDSHGVCVISITGSLTKSESIRIFRVCLAGLPHEEELSVTLPAATEPSANDNEAESLILSRYHDGNGNYKVHVRVLKPRGVGLQTKVNIWCNGQNVDLDTDEQGNAVYNVPDVIEPGESCLLTATVSGIHNAAKLNITRAKEPRHTIPAWTKRWYLHTNNGRAFLMICFVALLWLACFMVGPGESLINKMTFRNESTGLSTQEELYNSIVKDIDPSQKIVKQEHGSLWQHDLWKLAVILTLITIFYGIFSLREEITEGVRSWVEKLMDKDDAQSGDPRFEKLLEWAGVYSVARRKAKVEVINPDAPTQASKSRSHSGGGHPSLGTLFSFDLISDTLVAAFPAIMKKIF